MPPENVTRSLPTLALLVIASIAPTQLAAPSPAEARVDATGPTPTTVPPTAAAVTSEGDLPAQSSPSPTPSLSTARARPRWKRRIDRLTSGRPISVAIGINGRFLYHRKGGVRRVPASNEKLLLSMALLDSLGPEHRLVTRAAAGSTGRTVSGRLWILGAGDPALDRRGTRSLAHRIRASGVRRIRGRVMGSTGYFRHDWWAPGWKPSFPGAEVALPTALTFEGNRSHGRSVRDPERRAAASLTRQLRSSGVRVGGKPGAGRAPRGLRVVAEIRSRSLEALLRRQNVDSRNFDAEVLGKLLGVTRFGAPGTISKGARAIERWASGFGVNVQAHDGSGLSYRNRVTAAGVVRLLWAADGATWTNDLRGALPRGGQGTLAHRLRRVHVRAKTGTLDRISALSGWVRLERTGEWAEFSILSRGTSKDAAVRVEDRIVRAVAANAG